MGLKYDPDLQAELAEDSAKEWWWVRLVVVAVFLAVTIFLLQHWNVTPGLMVSVTVAVATLCAVAVLNSALTVVHRDLTLVASNIWWYANILINIERYRKKQLGEIEET